MEHLVLRDDDFEDFADMYDTFLYRLLESATAAILERDGFIRPVTTDEPFQVIFHRPTRNISVWYDLSHEGYFASSVVLPWEAIWDELWAVHATERARSLIKERIKLKKDAEEQLLYEKFLELKAKFESAA